MSSSRRHPRPTCHVCRCSTEGPVPSRNGGAFWLCRGCDITWSLDGRRASKDPGVVAPASSQRSRCVSLRALVEAQAKARGEDPQEWIEAVGLEEAARLFAA